MVTPDKIRLPLQNILTQILVIENLGERCLDLFFGDRYLFLIRRWLEKQVLENTKLDGESASSSQ